MAKSDFINFEINPEADLTRFNETLRDLEERGLAHVENRDLLMEGVNIALRASARFADHGRRL